MDNQETNENAKRPLTTFDLICAAKSFERSLERAEGVVDDDFEQALADFFADDDVEDKIKKCRYVLQRFAVEAQTLKDEANRLTDKRRSIEAKARDIEGRVIEFVETALGLPNAKTDKRNANRLILSESLAVALVKPKKFTVFDEAAALEALADTPFVESKPSLRRADLTKNVKKTEPSPAVSDLMDKGAIGWTEGRSLRWS